MEWAVARDHFFTFDLERSALVVGELATRLLQDEASRREVPGVAPALVVGVEPPRRDVAKVEGGRPEPPHALRAYREAPEEVEGCWHLFAVVGKPRDDQRPHELLRLRYAYALVVEPGTAATLGDEGLPSHRIVHHAGDDLASLLQRYGDGEYRQPVGVVRGAVEGVDDPTGIVLACALATLLGEHAVRRIGSKQRLSDDLLGPFVRLGDDIHLALVPHAVVRPETLTQHLARPPRRLERCFQLFCQDRLLLP